jgi:hypothetical protein
MENLRSSPEMRRQCSRCLSGAPNGKSWFNAYCRNNEMLKNYHGNIWLNRGAAIHALQWYNPRLLQITQARASQIMLGVISFNGVHADAGNI